MLAKFLSKLAKKREEDLDLELRLLMEEVKALVARADALEKSRDIMKGMHRAELDKRVAAEKRCKELTKQLEDGKAKEESFKLFEGLGESALFWFESLRLWEKAYEPAITKFNAGLLTSKGFDQEMGTRPVTLGRATEKLEKAIAGLLENPACVEILQKTVKAERLRRSRKAELEYKLQAKLFEKDPEAYMKIVEQIEELQRQLND